VMVRSQAKTPSDLKYLYLEMAVQHADNEDFDEAFEILFRYREEFPGDILVESAIYRVVLLAGKAIANNSEMEESEAMVITVKLLDQLHEAGWVPTRDSMDACLIRATLGDSEKALRLAHSFLDVSPWDHYYLNKAIEISQVLGETSLRDRAYHLISSGLAKYPGRSDLLELSETAFSRHSIRTLLIGQKFAA